MQPVVVVDDGEGPRHPRRVAEGDLGLRAVQGDLLHAADADAGDAHVVAASRRSLLFDMLGTSRSRRSIRSRSPVTVVPRAALAMGPSCNPADGTRLAQQPPHLRAVAEGHGQRLQRP
ncbi:hypothetical protein H4W81_008137 [Nonomuraea africana]|uniref:Uncharacterized protein n=1 Tax=Nonomuraea africana TaxID=46171 RepID=A0ABR9KTJ4_9ACTN|nr:hypothetical protein [Nonomuraea africana]